MKSLFIAVAFASLMTQTTEAGDGLFGPCKRHRSIQSHASHVNECCVSTTLPFGAGWYFPEFTASPSIFWVGAFNSEKACNDAKKGSSCPYGCGGCRYLKEKPIGFAAP